MISVIFKEIKYLICLICLPQQLLSGLERYLLDRPCVGAPGVKPECGAFMEIE
jgi:hypothetical protein